MLPHKSADIMLWGKRVTSTLRTTDEMRLTNAWEKEEVK